MGLFPMSGGTQNIDALKKKLSWLNPNDEEGSDVKLPSPVPQAAPMQPRGLFNRSPEPRNEDPGMAVEPDMNDGQEETDDNGMPKRSGLFAKENLLRTLLTIGLPAIQGAATGEGLLPGAMMGLAGADAGLENRYQSDVKNYDRQQDNIDRQTNAENSLKVGNTKFAETQRHNRAIENKPVSIPKLGENEKAIGIRSKIDNNQYVSDDDIRWYKARQALKQDY